MQNAGTFTMLIRTRGGLGLGKAPPPRQRNPVASAEVKAKRMLLRTSTHIRTRGGLGKARHRIYGNPVASAEVQAKCTLDDVRDHIQTLAPPKAMQNACYYACMLVHTVA